MRASQFLNLLPFGSQRRREQVLESLPDGVLHEDELQKVFEKNTKYLTNKKLTFEQVFEKKREREEEMYLEQDEIEEIDEVEELEEEVSSPSSSSLFTSLCLAHQTIRKDDPDLARLIRRKLTPMIQQMVSDAPHISITERAFQLYPDWRLTQKELFDIGKELKELYIERYNSMPAQKLSVFNGKEKWVNYYTRDHLEVIDQAIDKIKCGF